MPDRHDLARFVAAQAGVFETVLAELGAGRKASHWMWFVFPQIAGLGRSDTALRYAIASAAEASAYLAHPLLGERLRTATRALFAHDGRSAEAIMGGIDAVKLRSSMTLFDAVGGAEDPFARCLTLFFDGQRDPATLDLLARA